MVASAIVGGFFAIGGAIIRKAQRNAQREQEAKKLEEQQKNLTAVYEYKKNMMNLQKESLDARFKQGQKELNMARSVTEANQQTALRQGAEANWMQTQQMNSQMKNLALQGADEIGSASQRASLSGFRGSGSVNNLEKKQSDMVDSAKSDMQSQISFAKYQNMANSANAYSQSNVQLAQYANEKLAQKENYDIASREWQEQWNMEKDQYNASYNSLQAGQDYLRNRWNFALDDILDFGGTAVSAGLGIAGAVGQEKQIDKINDYNADMLQLQRDSMEYSSIMNANTQLKIAGADSSKFMTLPDTNMFSPNYHPATTLNTVTDNPYYQPIEMNTANMVNMKPTKPKKKKGQSISITGGVTYY